jgi:hypothetical protein
MTGEEMERAIEFLVKSQAAHDTRLDQLTAQVSETSRQLQVYAETQSEFIQIVTESMKGLAEAQARTERTVGETNARLDRLAAMVERHVTDGHGDA